MERWPRGGSPFDQMAKRLMDLCLSSVILAALSPLLAVIAILVRLTSDGPILYRGRRLGLDGRTFEMLKFRTMHVGSPDVRNPDGSTFWHPEDPRTTVLGRWLRRTSLDELPQLWNVLRGDMSLVGPRPDLPDQIQYYAPADHVRLTVRPGITGLAQVSGRNELTWEERRALDRQYLASRCLWYDLVILARTIPGVLWMRGVFAAAHGKPDDEPRKG
jgi:undecaprenyl phosphate N,N'-diacetylbacillosamine 1-phosphate transferase